MQRNTIGLNDVIDSHEDTNTSENGKALNPQFSDLKNAETFTNEIEKLTGQDEIKKLVEKCLIGEDEDIPEPKYILYVGDQPVLSLGDFSLFIGKAKSKKTFLMTMLVACLLCKVIECLKSGEFDEKKHIVWFDTEQSRYYVHRAYKRALQLAGITNAPKLKVYSLRPYGYQVRRKIIDYILYKNNPGNNILFSVIDGIRDLVADINDSQAASDIATWLLKVTEEKNLHIAVVLHTNKGDGFARGHLGTELVNKAQSVISIERDGKAPEISTVSPEFGRDKDFQPFAFCIGEKGLPEVLEDYASPKNENRKPKFNALEYDQKSHEKMAKEVFQNKEAYSYSGLWQQIKYEFKKCGIDIGDNSAKEVLSHWQYLGIISENINKREKYISSNKSGLKTK